MDFVLTLSWQACSYWALTLVFLAEPALLPGCRRSHGSRRGRREILWIASSILLGLAATATLHRFGLGNVEGWPGSALRGLGLSLYGAGVGLRYWAALTLGAWFTRDVEVAVDQELIGHGPYRRLRHPLYAGLLLVAAGMALLFANLPGTLVTVGLVAFAVRHRVRREESLLESRMAERYRDWKRRRAPLLPPFV